MAMEFLNFVRRMVLTNVFHNIIHNTININLVECVRRIKGLLFIEMSDRLFDSLGLFGTYFIVIVFLKFCV